MQNTGAMEDRLQIRELDGRHASGGTLPDKAAWVTTHFTKQGKAEIAGHWDVMWNDFDNVAILNNVGPIEVSGDPAEGTCTVCEVTAMKGGGIMKMSGIYADSFLREGGDWKFTKRQYRMLSVEMPQ